MSLFRKLSDWWKYERLHHYPELAGFDQADALARLEAYEREERSACEPWLTVVWILIGAFIVAWTVLMYFSVHGNAFMIVAQIPLLTAQYLLYRRVRRRVRDKVAAELRDGRLWTCVECGYDLRASPEKCPECGTSVPPPLRAGVRGRVEHAL